MGMSIVDGVPHVNGKPCTYEESSWWKLMDGAVSAWKCPECGAHLGANETCCMNLCHLSHAAARRFNSLFR